MKVLLATVLAVAPALPQTSGTDPKCAGAPDGIFGKVKGIYYGCLQGKEVRSNENGTVPAAWIADYDAKIREFDSQVRSAQTRRPEQKRTESKPPAVSRAAAAIPSRTITEQQVNSIPIGSTSADVVRELGKPYMRISGDAERLSYRLTTGQVARLEFENGNLTQIRIIASQ